MASLRRKWRRLRSGLYIPPLLWRLHQNEIGALWYPCCGDQGDNCDLCIDSDAPSQVQVVLAGIAEDTCGSCDSLNGTYVLTQQANPCYWRYILPSVICGVYDVRAVVYDQGGGNTRVQTGVTTGVGWYIEYRKDVTGLADCMNWSNYDVPWSGDGVGFTCDGSSSTSKLTTL